MSFKILGTGSYAPEHVVTNDDLSALVDTNDEWITQRIGVRSRHISETETNVDMAVKAAERALENAGISADELDLIIATTITGDTLSPGTGCMVQNRIGAHCPAFDLAAACSGFLFALETAAGFLSRGAYNRVLVVSAERMSGIIDWTDRGKCCIFGDGAGAAAYAPKAVLKEAKTRFGLVFQNFNLFPHYSVLKNITDAPLHVQKRPKDEVLAAARGLLAKMGLAGKEDMVPCELSGGQQQRVAIARALITKPKLVFADEPTGNLDSVSSAEVLGFLKRSVNELGQTIVMVTHDAVAASYADRAIVFADGQIVADEANPTAETMNDLLMAERERATRAAVTSTRADTLARLAGVKDVPNLPITDAPLPPAGRTGTMHHARAAAQHAR